MATTALSAIQPKCRPRVAKALAKAEKPNTQAMVTTIQWRAGSDPIQGTPIRSTPPPIQATVEGEPREIFPFLGSSRLAEVIDRFDDVAAIVHGHAHLGPFLGHTPGGKPVYNCAAEVPKDTGRPYALIKV